jgi:hypothetical protein
MNGLAVREFLPRMDVNHPMLQISGCRQSVQEVASTSDYKLMHGMEMTVLLSLSSSEQACHISDLVEVHPPALLLEFLRAV